MCIRDRYWKGGSYDEETTEYRVIKHLPDIIYRITSEWPEAICYARNDEDACHTYTGIGYVKMPSFASVKRMITEGDVGNKAMGRICFHPSIYEWIVPREGEFPRNIPLQIGRPWYREHLYPKTAEEREIAHRAKEEWADWKYWRSGKISRSNSYFTADGQRVRRQYQERR